MSFQVAELEMFISTSKYEKLVTNNKNEDMLVMNRVL